MQNQSVLLLLGAAGQGRGHGSLLTGGLSTERVRSRGSCGILAGGCTELCLEARVVWNVTCHSNSLSLFHQ